jgi:energy-coupling factor transport system substrate-specific component
MREVFTMWSNTRMVVLTALTAALYAAVLIPFKIATLVPGFTEVRPGVVVPFGFFGNFLFALTPYKLLGRVTASRESSGRETIRLLAAVVLASAICAATIAWGLDLLGLLPFTALGSIVFVNNLVVGALLGPVLLRLVGPRVASWHLLWTDVMEVPPVTALRRNAGIICMWLGGLGALGVGLALSIGLGGGQLFAFAVGTASPGVALGVAPFLVLYLVGCSLA